MVYLGDGLTHGDGFAGFAAALAEAGAVTELRAQATPAPAAAATE
ncbi:MAG: hypothetical protein WDN25_16645 [Acetobacteraceae bacterium]